MWRKRLPNDPHLCRTVRRPVRLVRLRCTRHHPGLLNGGRSRIRRAERTFGNGLARGLLGRDDFEGADPWPAGPALPPCRIGGRLRRARRPEPCDPADPLARPGWNGRDAGGPAAGSDRAGSAQGGGSSVGHEAIACAPHGYQEPRCYGVRFDLAAHPRHTDVEGAPAVFPFGATAACRNLRARRQPVGAACQKVKQIDFQRGQGQACSVRRLLRDRRGQVGRPETALFRLLNPRPVGSAGSREVCCAKNVPQVTSDRPDADLRGRGSRDTYRATCWRVATSRRA